MIAEAVAPVVETAEVVAETVAPVVNPGTLDWKKVAAVTATVVGVAACAYICKKALDKRKAEKAVIEVNPEPAPEEEPVVEEEPAPKTKAKK